MRTQQQRSVASSFYQTAASRTLNLKALQRMSEDEAYEMFAAARFAANGGEPFCPHCGSLVCYKLKTRRLYKCKGGCERQFSVTTGTDFADRKVSFRVLIEAFALFGRHPKGVNASEFSFSLGVNYKTAFELSVKIRKFMLEFGQALVLSGEVEIDGTQVGGFIRPPNAKKRAGHHRKWPHAHGEKKRVIVVARQRGGGIKTLVVKKEVDARDHIIKHTLGRDENGRDRTTIISDEGSWWNSIGLYRPHKTVNHKRQYWSEDADTNSAESFFATVKRAAKGIYHCITKENIDLFAAEFAWRTQHNRLSDGEKFKLLIEGFLSPERTSGRQTQEAAGA